MILASLKKFFIYIMDTISGSPQKFKILDFYLIK